MKKIILLLLILIPFIVLCKKKLGPPPAKHELLVSNAEWYAFEWIDWFNRDGWYANDGTTKLDKSVSYNYYAADEISDFVAKINESSVDGQTHWSEYTSYRPGGRESDEPDEFPWAGTRCQGLVYRSAIKAGYSIDSYYLNCIDCWMNLGTEVFSGDIRIGDIVLMDFDTTQNGYEHIGIVDNIEIPLLLSVVAIYTSPFKYKAGFHIESDYNTAFEEEFPGQHFYVYDKKYIRLPE